MIELQGIGKRFFCGLEPIDALKNINLSLPNKGLYFVIGKSGSGKSTLLGVLGGLLSPTCGSYFFEGKDITKSSQKDRRSFLFSEISFVFQDSNLIRDFTVEENIALAGADRSYRKEIVDMVGLSRKEKERAKNLSGGEAQRVAIARAMTKQTKVLLMDEPTGNLDAKNSENIFEILRNVSRDVLVVVVTHDVQNAYANGDGVITLSNGQIVSQKENPKIWKINLSVLPENDDAVDAFFLACDKAESLTIVEEEKRKELPLPPESKKIAVLKLIAQNYGERKTLEIIKNSTPDWNCRFHFDAKPHFGFALCHRYAMNMARKRPGRLIASALILSLGLALISLETSVVSFDEAKAMGNAFTSAKATISPLRKKQENKNLEEIGEYRTGEDFFTEVQNKFGNAFPILSGSLPDAISPTICYVVPVDKPLKLYDGKTYFPKGNGVYVSPFLYDITKRKDTLKITFTESAWSSTNIFEIQGLFDESYYPLDMSRHQADTSYQYKKKDLFLQKYALVIASANRCEKILEQCQKMILFGGNPALSDVPSTRSYYDATLDYSQYEGEILLYGSSPLKRGEAVISADFANLYFSSEMENNPNEIIGKRLKYRDLRRSPNWVSYQTSVNLFDVCHELIVKGITRETKSSIYFQDEDWSELCHRQIRCSTGIVCYNQNPRKLGEEISHSGFFCGYSFATPIYQLSSLSHSALSYVTVIVGLALVLICSAFLSLLCASEIKERSKEIAIIKSMGIGLGSVLYSFFILISCSVLPSLLSSFGLDALALKGINSALKDPDVYGISYDLFSFQPISIAICFSLCLASVLLSSIIPMMKLKRTDVYDTLKS